MSFTAGPDPSSHGFMIRGTGPKAIVTFVSTTFGPQALERIRRELDPQALNIVDEGPLVSEWYDLAAFERLIAVADRLFGNGDGQLAFEMGRFSAHFGMGTVHKIFLKIGSPDFILNRAADVWQRYFNAGRLEVTRVKPNHFRLALVDFGYVSQIFCLRISGWMQGVTELTMGPSGKAMHTRCHRKGDPHCEWDLTWG